MKLANGLLSNHWPGSIADVKAYRESASADDVAVLYRGAAPTGPLAGLGAPTAESAAHTINRTVLSQPNLRTVIMSLGANDVLAGRSTDEIVRDLTTLAHPRSATSPPNYRRPDGTPVRVILTTIPPLGLAANDPREATREELNDVLRVNYSDLGADGVVDLAAAVTDPAAKNAVAPSLLTNAILNGAFYDTIAQSVARAVKSLPPLEL